jgi:hypothetical protein
MQDQPAAPAPLLDKAALKRRIERLDVSADIKLLLDSLLEITHVVGGKIVQVGARVLDFIFDFAKAYPDVALGVAAALVIGFLIGSIPLLGPVLSPILTPLLLILGIGLGALNELTDASMSKRLGEMSAAFRDLGAP